MERTIESVLGQTYGDFIWYIVDNASADATSDIVDGYAKKDKRIYKIVLYKNDIRHHRLQSALIHAYSERAEWFTQIDADDEFEPTFLEKTVHFGDRNDLPLVVCGHTKVDARSGKILKTVVSDKNTIVKGDAFRTEFINYRRFFMTIWARLYRIKELAPIDYAGSKLKKYEMMDDACGTLYYLKNIDRFGIVNEALYRYYQDSKSTVYKNINKYINNSKKCFDATKAFIESYGEPDKLNHDYVYAIFISMLIDINDVMRISELAPLKKLQHELSFLNKPLIKKAFSLEKPHPQIRIFKQLDCVLGDIEGEFSQMAVREEEKTLFFEIQKRIAYLRGLL
jgi:glycosyltransferase involved in cell wall biosynthesis